MTVSTAAPARESDKSFNAASWLILLLALSIIGLSFAQTLYRLSLPSDGWSVEGNFWGPEQEFVFDGNLLAAPSPLYHGDILLAVEGRSVEEYLLHALTLNPERPANWVIGQTSGYTVWRDGRTPTVQVSLSQRPAGLVLSSIAGTLLTDPSVLPALLIGLFVFLLRPRNRAARLLLLLTACFFASNGFSKPAGGVLLGVTDLFYVGAYWPATFFNQLIWPLIIAPIYLHLFLVFPVAKWPVQRHPRLTFAVMYGFTPLIMALAYLATIGSPMAFWGTWSDLSEFDYFLVLGSVIVAMVHTLLREQDPAHRAQIRWVAYGAVITSLGAIVGGIMASLGVLEQYPLLTLLAFRLPFLAFPASVAIAVLRYHLFDIDLLINRTLVYVPLTAILAGLYAASISVSQKVFEAVTGQQSDAATVLTTLVVVAAFTPVKERLQSLVDRRFKEAPDPGKRLLLFEEQVRMRVAPLEPRQVTRRLLQEAAAAFEATSGEAYLGSGSARQLVATIGAVDGELPLKMPLENNGTLIGMVYLGPRKGGQAYGPRGSEIMRRVASTVARAIQEDAAAEAAGPTAS